MKKFFLVIMVFASVGLLWWYMDHSKVPKVKKTETKKQQTPEAELEQKVMAFTLDGRSPKGAKQWHLEGVSADIIGEDIHLNELKAVAYGDDVTVNLSSDKGIYKKEKGEVELIGSVKVVSSNGGTLETESATWSQNTKNISSDEFVTVTGEGMVAVGKGAVANADEKVASLLTDVKVSIEPDTRVKCDGPLTVSYDDNTAVFENNVIVKDKDGNLFSDKLTVYFDKEKKKLAKVVAEDNVKVKRGNSYSVSEKAVYTETTKTAELLGRPRIIIAPEEISRLQELEDWNGK